MATRYRVLRTWNVYNKAPDRPPFVLWEGTDLSEVEDELYASGIDNDTNLIITSWWEKRRDDFDWETCDDPRDNPPRYYYPDDYPVDKADAAAYERELAEEADARAASTLSPVGDEWITCPACHGHGASRGGGGPRFGGFVVCPMCAGRQVVRRSGGD